MKFVYIHSTNISVYGKGNGKKAREKGRNKNENNWGKEEVRGAGRRKDGKTRREKEILY